MDKSSIQFLHRRHSQARNRMLAAGSTLLVSSMLLIIILAYIMVGSRVDDAIVQAKMVAANSNAALMFEDAVAGKEILASLKASPNVESAALYSSKGKLLAVFQRSTEAEISTTTETLKENGYEWHLTHLDVHEAVKKGDRVVGSVVVNQSLNRFYRQLLSYIGIILAVSVGALYVVDIFLSRMKVAVSTAESHLDYLAHTDSVTALPNRRAFLKELNWALRSAQEKSTQVGLIMIDLDDFKNVNDISGHQAGDEVLRIVSRRFQEILGHNDILCRIGGDEFVVILRGIGKASGNFEEIAEKLLQQLALPIRYQEHEYFVTASAGGSVYPVDAQDVHELMRKADTAMYAAKQSGKNTYASFCQEMDEKTQRRMQLERLLRQAIKREELTLVYQPQVEGLTGRIVGVEALLRWRNKEIGDISPGEFIPIAEDSGLIIEIGKWVLQTACEQMKAWHDAGHESLHVSVNLSPRQFKAPSLISDIRTVIEQANIPPSHLILEITEGNMMENITANIDMLLKIQHMGVGISVDDFGTGYSSLAYLKRFPIQNLKIDRSFVQDVPGEGEGLVNAIISMAKSLGLSVVAEGVETKEQLLFLLQNGCQIFQGFYFSRPLPPESLKQLLSKGIRV